MKSASVLSCEHIHIHRILGRTDAFIAALQGYLHTLFTHFDEFGSVKIMIVCDDRSFQYEWVAGEQPSDYDPATLAVGESGEIDVQIDLYCEQTDIEEHQNTLFSLSRHGVLKDCVRHCILLEDEQTTSLMMSGMYRGAFLHGSVPFTSGNVDILEDTKWIDSSHRASFHFPEGAEDDAEDLLEQLETRLAIEANLTDNRRTLIIDGTQLDGRGDVYFYRDMLAKLVSLSDDALITGALMPESDTIFALLRFVQEGSSILVQTAVAE